MTECPTCGAALEPGTPECPSCGAPADGSRTMTLPSPGPEANESPPPSSAFDDARFVPGTLLAQRYRIVGLIGRGGMGEVYRAEDLKLGETVALKLLPPELTGDGAALARFHKEVKVSRQITHKNVCRMYDIGETEGVHFLSMEYIDGEDLASLLRRIGRLPQDKAVDFSRQLCAGLAAAHGEGVLHRDLKPANVMIDPQGRARIMDFGLAGLAEELQEGELAGTPAYMAPEQLAKGRVSFASDLYSLGLILYETFTGRRPFEAATRQELMALHRSGPPSQPSLIVDGLDPLVEQTVLRCLEEDPGRRPRSALEVSASLPGGDPLAAALEAGETPSPEMVAAAPEKGTLRPAVALGCFVAMLAMLAAWVPLTERTQLESFAQLEKPPEVLTDRAASLVDRWSVGGVMSGRPYTTSGWWIRFSYLRHLRETEPGADRWDVLRNERPAVMTFWYRESPRPLHEWSVTGSPQPHDPPLLVAGMARVELDPQGRLLGWWAFPRSHHDSENRESGPPWAEFFTEAGLDRAAFRPAEARWTPPLPSDERRAWEGRYPERPDLVVRVEAASFDGQPVYFVVAEPWDDAAGERMAATPGAVDTGLVVWMMPMTVLILLAGTWLAQRNLKSGRADRRGSARLAAFVFSCLFLSSIVGGYHTLSLDEFESVLRAVKEALFWAVSLWVSYLALEPLVRRFLPQGVVSWSRLLRGSPRDPLVGRDVLIGALFGVVGALLFDARVLISPRLGQAFQLWDHLWLGNLLAPRQALAVLLGPQTFVPLLDALGMTFVFVLLYALLRRKGLAVVVFTVISALTFPFQTLLFKGLIAMLITLLVVRFGLLASTSYFFVFLLLNQSPITTDFTLWYADRTVFALALVVALGFYGLRTSLAGRPLFGSSNFGGLDGS